MSTCIPNKEGGTAATTRPRRIRNPDLRRAAILEAALAAFSERGYARATMRDIAQRAGVTHGLVQRHFGSKEELFLAAVPGTRDWADLVLPGDPKALPDRIAAAYAERLDADSGINVLVALLRSAAADIDAAKRLYATVQQGITGLYSPFMQGADVEIRTELLLALLIGVTFSRHIIGTGPLAETPKADLKRQLASAVQQLLLASPDQEEAGTIHSPPGVAAEARGPKG